MYRWIVFFSRLGHKSLRNHVVATNGKDDDHDEGLKHAVMGVDAGTDAIETATNYQ